MTSLSLLAAADAINLFSRRGAAQLPPMYSNTWGTLVTSDGTFMTVKDPAWQHQLSKLRTHFNKYRGFGDFFDFDILPAGASFARRQFLESDAVVDIKRFKPEKIYFGDLFNFSDINWFKDSLAKKRGSPAYARWLAYQKTVNPFSDINFVWLPSAPKNFAKKNTVARDSDDYFEYRVAALAAGGDCTEGILVEETEFFTTMKSLAFMTNFLLTGQLTRHFAAKLRSGDVQKGISFTATPIENLGLTFVHELMGAVKNTKEVNYSFFKISPNFFGVPLIPALSELTGYPRAHSRGLRGNNAATILPSFHLASASGLFNIFDTSQATNYFTATR